MISCRQILASSACEVPTVVLFKRADNPALLGTALTNFASRAQPNVIAFTNLARR